MRQSELFTKTRKEAPADETALNAKLLIRAGFVHKEMGGVYSYLPLGWRTLNQILSIIRQEMKAVGGQELQMTTLQDPAPWQLSGRWSDEVVDNWFKSTLANGNPVGLANTHEEVLAQLMTHHIDSYKDLPVSVFQFQNKFRNELRSKSGIMRGREFLMKDLYSFSPDEGTFREYYEQVAEAYYRIYRRCGIGEQTFRTFASGGSFSKYSDEFQTLTEAGEDSIYLDRDKGLAINQEVYGPEAIQDTGVDEKKLVQAKAVEVGNIFPLGTQYAEALGLTFKDRDGQPRYPVMGSYGIGLGRLMGTIVEIFGREDSMVWPREVAPFSLHLIRLGEDEGTRQRSEELYQRLTEAGATVLYDDREITAGAKFADSDLIGVPHRVIISQRSLEEGGAEVTDRRTDQTRILDLDQLTGEKFLASL